MYSGLTINRASIQPLMQQRVLWATGIALLIHMVGLVGMIWIDTQWFSNLTPVNLILMLALVMWTQQAKNLSFYIFFVIAFLSGMLSEIIGVHTGLLFGDYSYGKVLGFSIYEVPLMIGVNWFMVVFTSAAAVLYILTYLKSRLKQDAGTTTLFLIDFMLISGGSLLATFFDWVMEPVAVKLGFWNWSGDGDIPFLNYVCWYLLSMILLIAARLLGVQFRNPFALYLFLIQLMFFIALRALI
jgi:putative membrane protein